METDDYVNVFLHVGKPCHKSLKKSLKNRQVPSSGKTLYDNTACKYGIQDVF